MKPHICFVAPNAYPLISGDFSASVVGGAELQQATLARSLQGRGYNVSMICSDFGQPETVDIDGIVLHKTVHWNAGIPVIRFLYPRLTSIWSALKQVNADVYYTRGAGMLVGIVAAFGQRKGRHTIFAAACNSDFSRTGTKIRFRRDLWIYRYGVRKSTKVVVQNSEQKRKCRSTYGRNAQVIPNCYPIPDNTNWQKGSTILWVATIRALKRPELLIELATLLPHRNFVMVGGEDRYQKVLHDSISRVAAKTSNVQFQGFVPYSEIDAHFEKARVVVNTSDVEGFPNTFLQAWARSIPTVSFFDCQAYCGKERVGYRVGSMEEMAEIVERLFSDDREYEKIGKLCSDYCKERHSVESVVDRLESLIKELPASVDK